MIPESQAAVQSAATYPLLKGRWPQGQEFEVTLDQENFVVGRTLDADLVVPQSAPFVSGRHFEVQHTPAGYAIVDLNSTNGTQLNSQYLLPMTPKKLQHGDIIRVGSERYGSSIGFAFSLPGADSDENIANAGFQTFVGVTVLEQIERVTIGRNPENDIILNSPQVGGVHAIISKMDSDNHYIQAKAPYQIVVNGTNLPFVELKAGDEVQIGPFLLTYDGATLLQYASQGYRLDVCGLYKEVKTKNGPLRILDDISLTILPREFVALVGGSGAGKSTLLDALNGFRPANGQVLINGRNLYTHYGEFRAQIGYVPQYDILPTTLTVEAALRYAAQLRLAADITAAEREARITQALETVEMNDERLRQTRIGRLSGGQRKRVSIAAELLADPKIFFLDEPAAGLDPGLEKKLMYTLRKMADEGRTVIVITHATANIIQVDQVAFLAQGKLIYFGPPREAQDYFEVGEFADIYEMTEREGTRWRQVFTEEKPEAFREYVQTRQAAVPQGDQPGAEASQRPGLLAKVGQSVRQFSVLSRRMLRLTLSDPVALFVSLLVMPFVAVQQLLVSAEHELVGDPAIIADAARAAETLTENYLPALESHTMIFGMAILAFLVGAFGGSQELIKERSIYQRERMVNLGLLPYISSKVLVFGGFALIQIAIYMLVLSLGLELPDNGVWLKGPLEMGLTLFLTVMVGMATGLFISAVSPNATVAVYLVLIVVFFQYLFGGAIHNLRDKPIELQSYIAATRWSALAMGTTVDVNELAEATIVCGNKFELDSSNVTVDPATGAPNLDALQLVETDEPACTNRAMEPDELYLPYGDDESDLFGFWGRLAGLGGVFLLGTALVLKRMDRR